MKPDPWPTPDEDPDRPSPEPPPPRPRQAGSEGDLGLGLLASVPLTILAVEGFVGAAIFGLAVMFFVTIFFGFVGMILIYLGLWLAVGLNAVGTLFAGITLLVGHRNGSVLALVVPGLLGNAAALGLALYALHHFR